MQHESIEVKEWKAEMKQIESQKKHLYQQPKFYGYIKHNDKRSNYNVITQRHNDQQKDFKFSQTQTNQSIQNQQRSFNEPFKRKYFNSYDIINCQKIGNFKNNEEFKVKNFVIPPRQINFNIVTNVLTDESLYKNGTAKFEIPKQKGKKNFTHLPRDINIITVQPKKENEKVI